ncbi:MAG: hypothetical protein C0507_18280 [Cyanobacteria bacterium PR.3.49]|nr:hypothetical protein [Cyanobacteria bacterium PR.3.49]
MNDKKKTALSSPATPSTIKFTRGQLGMTLKALKSNQESLQTAVSSIKYSTETAKFRYEKLQLHGYGSLAYSSLQKGMQYYMHPELGYIAYTPLRDGPNSVCVLADPICSKENIKPLVEAFMKEKSDPVFLHISHDTGKVLNEMGFTVNELGVETIIDIQKFNVVGNKKQQLRNARNGAKKDNVTVVEINTVDDEMLKSFKKISDGWMKEKVISDNEMQFIVRPVVFVDEIDVRKFVAIKDNQVVGFVIFDPMYEDGKVSGYIANHLRTNLDRTYSVVDFIILEALEKFKQEGKKDLSLGLSPLAKVDDSQEFKHSKLLKAHFRYAFEKANFLYNFKNLARHKLKYRPELDGAREEKVYCAMNTRFFLIRLYDVYRVLGLNPLQQTINHIKRSTIELFRRTLCKKQAEQTAAAAQEESKNT